MSNDNAPSDLRRTFEAKLLPLLGAVLNDSVRYLAELRFNKEHPQQLAIVCVYSTIIEQAHGEKVLIEKGQVTSMPVLLRSIMESYADLLALIADPTYVDRMLATFVKEKKRLLKSVQRSPASPYLSPLGVQMDIPQALAALDEELEQFRKKGKQPLSASDRFDAAKLTQEYQTMYWQLCLEGHNNVSALEERHIEKHGENYEVVLYKEARPETLVLIVDSLLGTLIDSGVKIHKFFSAADRFEAHQHTLNSHRADYSKAH